MIKAIVFDMDGVLLDAKDWHYEALNKALVDSGKPPISREDHEHRFDGLPTKTKLKAFGYSTEEIHRINELKQKYTHELIEQSYSPNLNTLNAIKILKNLGYRMGLCSNSVRSTVDMFMQKSGYDHYFEFSLSNEDVKRAKPNAEIYTLANTKLGHHPTEVLVLEDNVNGIRAATDAGNPVLVIEGGEQSVVFRLIEARIKELDAADKQDE